jgi:hypothetical protein
MNYRNETYLVLSEKAAAKLTGGVEGILYGRKSEHASFKDGSALFQMKRLSFGEDKTLTDWMDTLNADLDETFEVFAMGGELDEMEHVTNKLPYEDRLSVEVRVLIDDMPVDDIVAEGGRK